MAKVRSVDSKLSQLKLLRHEATSPQVIDELRKALKDKSNLVVAEAAEIVGEKLLTEFTSELVAAFDRFMIDPVETDKLCKAKIAIIETLNKLEFDQEEIFLKAIHHVQLEPRWGEPDDTADALRGVGAFGLVRIGYRDVILLLVDLLNDLQKVARSSAAQALGSLGSPAVIPLLRFKVLTGDPDPEVIAECFNALMAVDAKQSMPFIAEFLNSTNEGLAEGAAFALGESRRPEALEILKAHWAKSRNGPLREVIPLAIAMTRLPAGINYLIELLAREPVANAMTMILALAIHRHNPTIKERVGGIVGQRNDAKLRQQFAIKFGE